MPVAARKQSRASPPAPQDGHPLSPAFLAMLPMFLCYELGVRALGGERRNAAETLLGLWLAPLGESADGVRWGLLGACAVVALYLCRQQKIRVREAVARVWLEGLVVALTLGPALVLLTAAAAGWSDHGLDVAWDSSREPAGLAFASYLFGGAVYEELLFRIGLYGLFFWTSLRVARLVGLPEVPARWSAEALALSGSALFFAAFHFQRFTRWLWDGGLDYTPALFAWMVFAGLLLGLIYRWRGPGVAAWAHGLFNLALLVGIDPDVLA